MTRFFAALLALMLFISCASAEEQTAYPETASLPDGAVMETETPDMRRYLVEDTGEIWTVHQSEGECLAVAELPLKEPVAIDEFVAMRWPDAWILKSEEKEALFLDAGVAGRCSQTDGVLVTEMSFGEFRAEGRMLAAGAAAAMALYRPQAVVAEIELDEDDGLVIYEGEAYVDGIEYEFELDAYTGRLLEWERD
jgi:hypothetical protein